jgi:transcriptional regulator with XRE-family HTH domain
VYRLANTIGEKIKKRRLLLGLSQSALGALLNVGRASISQWENGIHTPDHEIITKLATILKTSTDYLLGHDQVNLGGDIYDIEDLLDNMQIEIKAGGKPLTKAQREEARRIMRYVLREQDEGKS